MTVRAIRLFPEPGLSQPCKPIVHFDATLGKLIEDLKDTLHASPGVGLAAPQIGVPSCVSVIDVGRTKRKPIGTNHGLVVLINPELTKGEGIQVPREGCLSVPDFLANVNRYNDVQVTYWDAEGQKRDIKATGFEALALQHEIDHLHGKLFLDRVSNLKTDLFRRKENS